MTRTLVATPEPQRRNGRPWPANITTATGGGWIVLDRKR